MKHDGDVINNGDNEEQPSDRDVMARQVFADYQGLRSESFNRVFATSSNGGNNDVERQAEQVAIDRFLWSTAVRDEGDSGKDKNGQDDQRSLDKNSQDDHDHQISHHIRDSCTSLHAFLLQKLEDLEESVLQAQDHEVSYDSFT